jgi:hypothetical protein
MSPNVEILAVGILAEQIEILNRKASVQNEPETRKALTARHQERKDDETKEPAESKPEKTFRKSPGEFHPPSHEQTYIFCRSQTHAFIQHQQCKYHIPLLISSAS